MAEDKVQYNTSSAHHVFIIGSKSIGQYGGYETFVDRLIEQHQNDPSVKYHVACKANGDGIMDETKLSHVPLDSFDSPITIIKRNKDGKVAEFEYRKAYVFKILCPNIGSGVALYYDRAAVLYSIKYCIENDIQHPIFYILTCRIGLFIDNLYKKIKAVILLN